MSDKTETVLVEVGQIKGQLGLITQMLQANHDATNQRIDDLRHAMESRVKGVEGRVLTLEQNERSTALKASATGALAGTVTGFVTAIAIAVAKLPR